MRYGATARDQEDAGLSFFFITADRGKIAMIFALAQS
jgi:hypothetical protein